MSIIRLEKLLKSEAGSALDKIVQTAQQMDELTSLLRQNLAHDLGSNLLAASLREDGELVLVASSSAWAAKLRFESEALMEAARQSGTTVASCRVSVSKNPAA